MGKGGSSVLVAGIVVVAACSGASRASSPPPLSPPRTSTSRPVRTPTTRPRPTTTTTPAFSFDDRDAPPEVVNTGMDYVAIVRSLEDHGNWLGAHRPDPTLTQDTVAAGTRLFAGYIDDLTYLRQHDLRFVQKLDAPTTVTIISATKDAFSARLVVHVSAQQILDRAGHVTRERRFAGPSTYLDLVVLAHGRWYLAASDEQTPPVVHL